MLSNKLKELRKTKRLTLEELAKAVGTSRQTIHRYENGVISNVPAEKVVLLAEALGVTPAELMGWERAEYNNMEANSEDVDNALVLGVKRLPILGEIACGQPIFANEEHESFALVDADLDADFCLRAKGDSMTGARIMDGDVVFIHSQNAVDNGEIAAVVIDDEATLKRVYYYPADAKLILSAENPKYPPLVYTGEELNRVNIIGKALAFQSRVI